jgi:GntR family transcriptional regulator
MQFARNDRDAQPLYAQLRDELAARIAAQEWLPGMVIPPERELAATYCVSIQTTHRAIEDLVEEGLLTQRQGRGTFVRRPLDSYPGHPVDLRRGRILP